MVIGGQAVLLYGEPRLTEDIDLTLGVPPDRLPDLLAVVGRVGLQPLVDPEPFVAETFVLPCADTASGVRVDWVFSLPGFERGAIERAETVEVGGAGVRFAAAADLVILKLVAGRPRDVEDVRGVLLRQLAIDLDHVRQWLAEFDAALGLDAVATLDRLLDETAD